MKILKFIFVLNNRKCIKYCDACVYSEKSSMRIHRVIIEKVITSKRQSATGSSFFPSDRGKRAKKAVATSHSRVYKGVVRAASNRGALRAIQLIKFIRMRPLIFSFSNAAVAAKGFESRRQPFKGPVGDGRVSNVGCK